VARRKKASDNLSNLRRPRRKYCVWRHEEEAWEESWGCFSENINNKLVIRLDWSFDWIGQAMIKIRAVSALNQPA